jgi:hypothetical protein
MVDTPRSARILDRAAACGSADGYRCGPVGQYGKANSLCCGNGVGLVICDAANVALTHAMCPDQYSCVQRFGWSSWKRDTDGDEDGDEDGNQDAEEGIYAQCERID